MQAMQSDLTTGTHTSAGGMMSALSDISLQELNQHWDNEPQHMEMNTGFNQ
jgi:hypothetical protein